MSGFTIKVTPDDDAAVFGPVVNRTHDQALLDALNNGDAAPAIEPSKARLVWVQVLNETGATQTPSIRESENGFPRASVPIPTDFTAVLSMTLAPGELFEWYPNGCTIDTIYERAIG